MSDESSIEKDAEPDDTEGNSKRFKGGQPADQADDTEGHSPKMKSPKAK